MSSGMRMLRDAAEAASAVYAKHWLKHWTTAHHSRLQRAQTDWGRRMAVSGLFADIETIMEDLETHGRA